MSSPLPQLLQHTVKYWLHASEFSGWLTLKWVSFHQNKEHCPWECFQHGPMECFQHGRHQDTLAFAFKVTCFIQTMNSDAHEYSVIMLSRTAKSTGCH